MSYIDCVKTHTEFIDSLAKSDTREDVTDVAFQLFGKEVRDCITYEDADYDKPERSINDYNKLRIQIEDHINHLTPEDGNTIFVEKYKPLLLQYLPDKQPEPSGDLGGGQNAPERNVNPKNKPKNQQKNQQKNDPKNAPKPAAPKNKKQFYLQKNKIVYFTPNNTYRK